jgi:group I intron endonuclease
MKIYKIVNKNNSKIYVGKTSKSLEERFSGHLKCAKDKVNRYLYDSMNHHGYESFEILEIEECKSDEELNEHEKFWIKQLNSLYPNGYNMTDGGDGGNTVKHWSEEDRVRLYKSQGEKRKGPRSEQFKTTMSFASKIREQNKTEEQKAEVSQKISNTLKMKYKSGEIKSVTPVNYGKDNWNYTEVDIGKVLELIKIQWKLVDIAKEFDTTAVTVGSKLKQATGKTFSEWRREYGIRGRYGSIKRIDKTN